MKINKINKNFHKKKNFKYFLLPFEDYHLFFIKKKLYFANIYKNIKKPFIILFKALIKIIFKILFFSN